MFLSEEMAVVLHEIRHRNVTVHDGAPTRRKGFVHQRVQFIPLPHAVQLVLVFFDVEDQSSLPI